MRRRLRILASTSAALLLLALGRPLYIPLLQPPRPAETTSAVPLQKAAHFAATMATLYQHRGNTLALQATTDTAAGDMQGKEITFRRLTARIFAGGQATLVQGRDGSWRQAGQVLRLSGPVRVAAPTFTATGSALTLHAASRLLTASGPVDIRGKQYRVSGHSLRYTIDRGQLLVRGGNGTRVRFQTLAHR